MRRTLPLVLLALASCGTQGSEEIVPATPDGGQPEAPAAEAADPVAHLRESIAEFQKRPEHDAPQLEVSHILISFKGAPRVPATRSKEEAEQLTAELLLKIENGADFESLKREYSDDSGGQTYPMTTATRGGMVAAFGDTAWRLQVGEIGVAPWDAQKSPYGWHIVKRIK